MSSWISDYVSALEARDAREKAQSTFISAYTKLADRTAALEAASNKPVSSVPTPPPSLRPETLQKPRSPAATKQAAVGSPDALIRLRADLALAQKSKSEMQMSLKSLTAELDSLRLASRSSTKQVSDLGREKASLERKLRDREEELKEKRRLVENVHDEMVTLNLQLNMAEQRSDKLERENKQLVERWMERMGNEANAMNDASQWS